MDISKLKSRRTDISALVEAAKESAGGSKFEKEDTSHIWKPTVDKAGNGYAVIRFLPAEGDVPWVRYWDHGFKGDTGKWYIERSLTSLGQTDPLGELNAKLWNSGNEDDRATVRKQKRRLHYVVNIQVVSDPSAPHNEGKVFLYQFGKKIFDKIQDLMQPQFPGETPCDPFDLWAGADFQLKIRQLDGYRNYDKSEFKSSTALAEGDEVQLQAVMNQIYDINYYTDPANYKTYDELQTKLFEVLGETAPRTVKEEVALDTVAEPAAPKTVAPATADAADDAGDDDAMSYFQKLANAD
tara:strand:+ start:1660 stop:2550 length:891 start_codon:yes stop_codon:yes gene_type:complete